MSVRSDVHAADPAWGHGCVVWIHEIPPCLMLLGSNQGGSWGQGGHPWSMGMQDFSQFHSVSVQPPASKSWSRTPLCCLLVDTNEAASPFRQGMCLPACWCGISGASVLTGASSINNNHCQSRLLRAEQSEVICLWKAPQSMSACCDPEMLAWKSITW